MNHASLLLTCSFNLHFLHLRDFQDNVAAEEGPDVQPEEPTTRAEFNELRARYSDTVSMALSFLSDHEHHIRVRILVKCGRPLHQEYQYALKCHQQGQTMMARWQAERANGLWFTTILNLLRLLESEEFLQQLDLRPSAMSIGKATNLSDPGIAKDISRCQSMFNLVAELCHARAWSQLHHSLCLPHCFAKIFSPTQAQQDQARRFLQMISANIQAIEDSASRNPSEAALQKFIKDLGTVGWPLVREILHTGHNVDWDLSDSALRDIGWALFGSAAETKHTCENTFSWLADSAARQSKALKFNQHTKYMYLTTCPYADEGGSTTIKPQPADIKALDHEDYTTIESLGLFSQKMEALPIENTTVQDIASCRPAGYAAQRLAAAGMAFAINNVRDGVFQWQQLETDL